MSSHIKIDLQSELTKTGRVLQVAGMFDVPIDQKITTKIRLDLTKFTGKPWSVGLIVGPSGSGKSTIAAQMWPALERVSWGDGALVDEFPRNLTTREITDLLTSVGLSSPPAWLRPYRALSNGEQFRADMARELASAAYSRGRLAVVDEFTSVVDRQVAKITSHAVQRAARAMELMFVAVTCHYDVIDWLQPDWVIDMATSEFSWRLVQPRPAIQLDIYPADRSLWKMFARHHYLTGELSRSAQCFAAYVDGQPVAFTSYIHFPHARVRDIKMGHRLVVLPDWQGLGIGGRLDDWLGEYLHAKGFRYHNTVAHPALIRYYRRSPRWRQLDSSRRLVNSSTNRSLRGRALDPRFLTTHSFAYVPERKAK